MDMREYITSLKRTSKKDDVPGTLLMELEKECPVCGKKMKRYKPCCGNPYGYDKCICDYKIVLTGNSV